MMTSRRALRDRLYRENFEFVKEQRILCMQQGAWFVNARYKASGSDSSLKRSSPAKYKFCRLSHNRRQIYWLDALETREIRAGLEKLREKSASSIGCAEAEQLTLAYDSRCAVHH